MDCQNSKYKGAWTDLELEITETVDSDHIVFIDNKTERGALGDPDCDNEREPDSVSGNNNLPPVLAQLRLTPKSLLNYSLQTVDSDGLRNGGTLTKIDEIRARVLGYREKLRELSDFEAQRKRLDKLINALRSENSKDCRFQRLLLELEFLKQHIKDIRAELRATKDMISFIVKQHGSSGEPPLFNDRFTRESHSKSNGALEVNEIPSQCIDGIEMEEHLESDHKPSTEIVIQEAMFANSYDTASRDNSTCDDLEKDKESMAGFTVKQRHRICEKASSTNPAKEKQKLYECEVCHKKYFLKSSLVRHKATHGISQEHLKSKPGNLTQFICEVCGKVSDSKSKHTRHMWCHRPQKKITKNAASLTCKVCNLKLNSLSAKQTHYHTHSEEELSQHNITLDTRVCDICGFITRNSYLYRHKVLKHPESVPGKLSQSVCNVCGRVFDSRIRLALHIKRKHIYSSQMRHQKGPQGVSECLTCDICQKVLPTASHLKQHKKCHDKRFLCDICGKGFSFKILLLQHSKVHTEDRSYYCIMCDKSFSFKETFEDHNKLEHHELDCKVCGKNFHNLNNLVRHVSVVHKSIRKFQCRFCRKFLTTKVGRDIHENIHTGRRPYECDRCELKFGDYSTLAKHKSRH